MITVTAKLDGSRIIAVENGIGWSSKTKGSVKVKSRPFRDMLGKVLTFNSLSECVGWCITRNEIMNLNHF